MSAPERHALLSASGSHKWLHCPPSARLEETFPESTSEYAEEGRLAHAIAELKVRKHFYPMGPQTFAKELKKLQKDPRYNPEMDGYTNDYLEYIQKLAHSFASVKPYIVIEKQVDYSHIAPEGFGTADCILIGGTTLHVVDFKYGKGVAVSAVDNSQMMLYALGALRLYAMLYAIDEVVLHIVQPRLGEPSTWATTAAELTGWGESKKPTAQLAFEGKGEFCAGDWCKFCRTKAQCRARSDTMTALEAFGGKLPPLLTNAEVGDILLRAQTLAAWAKDLEDYALKALLNGEEVPGWKAVEGRSNRAFSDTDKAFKVLTDAGYDEALLYERKPITLTAVEKLLKKADFTNLLGSYIVKPPGAPKLATENDNREAISNKVTAAEAFSEVA